MTWAEIMAITYSCGHTRAQHMYGLELVEGFDDTLKAECWNADPYLKGLRPDSKGTDGEVA